MAHACNTGTGRGRGRRIRSRGRCYITLLSQANSCYLLAVVGPACTRSSQLGLGMVDGASQEGCGGHQSYLEYPATPATLPTHLFSIGEGLEYTGWEGLKEEGCIYTATGKPASILGADFTVWLLWGHPVTHALLGSINSLIPQG